MRSLLALWLSFAAWPTWGMQGANFLQSASAPWGSPQAAQSLARLRDTGADWVAFVPFLDLRDAASCDLAWSSHYNLAALRSVIRQARGLDLRVALKPQILVPGSWAGEIAAHDEAGWSCWFSAYQALLLPLARLAEAEGVELFVAGTELKRTETRPQWQALLRSLRAVFNGRLSYVFHAPEDVAKFSALAQLDWVGLSLYPRLGRSPAEAFRATAWQRFKLGRWARAQTRPVWIAEVGIPSRAGAGEAPWLWDDRRAGRREPDPAYQATALAYWLEALSGGWNRGTLIWNWFSDPQAGGPLDTDFTPQNKPAEAVLRCFWQGADMTECTP